MSTSWSDPYMGSADKEAQLAGVVLSVDIESRWHSEQVFG